MYTNHKKKNDFISLLFIRWDAVVGTPASDVRVWMPYAHTSGYHYVKRLEWLSSYLRPAIYRHGKESSVFRLDVIDGRQESNYNMFRLDTNIR